MGKFVKKTNRSSSIKIAETMWSTLRWNMLNSELTTRVIAEALDKAKAEEQERCNGIIESILSELQDDERKRIEEVLKTS